MPLRCQGIGHALLTLLHLVRVSLGWHLQPPIPAPTSCRHLLAASSSSSDYATLGSLLAALASGLPALAAANTTTADMAQRLRNLQVGVGPCVIVGVSRTSVWGCGCWHASVCLCNCEPCLNSFPPSR